MYIDTCSLCIAVIVVHATLLAKIVSTIDIIVTATAVGNTIPSVSRLKGTDGRPVNVGKLPQPPVNAPAAETCANVLTGKSKYFANNVDATNPTNDDGIVLVI